MSNADDVGDCTRLLLAAAHHNGGELHIPRHAIEWADKITRSGGIYRLSISIQTNGDHYIQLVPEPHTPSTEEHS